MGDEIILLNAVIEKKQKSYVCKIYYIIIILADPIK